VVQCLNFPIRCLSLRLLAGPWKSERMASRPRLAREVLKSLKGLWHYE